MTTRKPLRSIQKLNICTELLNWAIKNKYIDGNQPIYADGLCTKDIEVFKQELSDDLDQNTVHVIYIQRDDNIFALEETPLALCEGSEHYCPTNKSLQEVDDKVLEQIASVCSLLTMEDHLFIMELDI